MQTLWLLSIGYAVLPILSGYDKYWKWLTSDWCHYLSKSFGDASPWNVANTMKVVGAVEIVAGIIVFFAPRISAPIVAICLAVSKPNYSSSRCRLVRLIVLLDF